MAKSIPAKEFKAAVKSLNEILAEAGEPKIKVVGVKKEVVVEEFTNTVLNYIDKDKAEALPDDVIDFYNTHIATDEEDAPEEKQSTGKKSNEKQSTGKKPAGKKPAGKKPAGKKSAGKKSNEKQSTGRKRTLTPSDNTREKSCVEALKKGGSFEKVIKEADDIYVKGGGNSNISQSKRLMERGVKYLYHADVLDISDKGIYKLSV